MSIEQTDKIDGIGVRGSTGRLWLLLTDHLGWEDERRHLELLQEKINNYIAYVDEKQYKALYPKKSFPGYVLYIAFQEEITENCEKFLNVVANVVAELNMEVRITVGEGSPEAGFYD